MSKHLDDINEMTDNCIDHIGRNKVKYDKTCYLYNKTFRVN